MPEFNSRQKTNLASNKKMQPSDHGRITVQVATTPATAPSVLRSLLTLAFVALTAAP